MIKKTVFIFFILGVILPAGGLLAGERKVKAKNNLTNEYYTNRFKLRNGVVFDSETGLEWVAGPDRDTTWKDARTWVAELKLEGGKWRMPTRRELGTIYVKGLRENNLVPLFKSNGWFVWSSEKKGHGAWYFNFLYGIWGWDNPNKSGTVRGFAVRSKKRG